MRRSSRENRAALYMRLSKDDERTKESQSISTQRKMLRSYALENGFEIAGEYADDGYSGTTFDRPKFSEMIGDIEKGLIDIVIVKDLSRLGRDYIKSGYYTDIYFPENGIRFIAVNDGLDSKYEDNDIAPFKNVINELYARDISRKIRSALKTKMKDGAYIGSFAPYGYKKSNDNKNRLLIDAPAAENVREIFTLAAQNISPSEIADTLNRRKVSTPSKYCGRTLYTSRGEWTSSMVCSILKNTVYLGHTSQGKTRKSSHKSRRQFYVNKSEWIVVENTHEAIIPKELFKKVQKRAPSRNIKLDKTFSNAFSGIAKCGDCGRNMSVTSSGSGRYLVCSGYKMKGKKECESHAIRYDTLNEAVRRDMCALGLINKDEPLIKKVLEKYIENIEICHAEKSCENTTSKTQRIKIKYRLNRDKYSRM